MKKWIMGLMVLATMSSAYAVEFNLNMDLKINSNEFFKIEKTTGKYYRVYSIVNGNTHILLKADDQVVADVNQPNSQRVDEEVEYSIQPLDKNTVRIIDRTVVNGKKLNIDAIVQAKIERSILGTLKSIHIESEEILALYHDILDDIGLTSLRGLNIQTAEAEISTDSKMKGIDCVVKNDSMSCETGVTIEVKLKAEEAQ